jgi:hypothetical protein
MKVIHLNKKLLAVACSTVLLFVGMTLMADEEHPQNEKKKYELPPPPAQHEQHMMEYRNHLNEQQHMYQQSMAQFQREKRMAHYRYQREYADEMLRQQRLYERERIQNYRNDHFFNTCYDRRYNRGGTYYRTNRYGIEHLQQAIQYGYSQGFQAGRADREDRWRYDFESCNAYRDANYGFNGYYVNQADYNYYFREGFRRGYEDGYHRRYNYGRVTNGKYIILRSILTGILPFEILR